MPASPINGLPVDESARAFEASPVAAGAPLCTAGERAAPPDNVGGTSSYLEFLKAIGNTKHPEHEDMLIWIGGAFDPEGFDLNAINRTLQFGSP